LETKLQQRGVKEVQVSTASPLLRIWWRKGFPFLSVVLAIILGIVILAILIVGWRLFREIAEVVPAPIITIGAILLVVLVAFALRKRRQWA
jgi:MFS superfamily sulfate permease-like transporter